MNKRTAAGVAMMTTTAFIWGTAFVAQSVGAQNVSTFTFLFFRSVLGVLFLVPLVLLRRKKAKKDAHGGERITQRQMLIAGACCGFVCFISSVFQQAGIERSTTGKAGFITALYIIIVPIFGLFLKKRVASRVWFCVVVAAVGMYLLCARGESGFGVGEILLVFCACSYSVHILTVDHFAPRMDAVELSCMQFAVTALCCLPLMLIIERPAPSAILDAAFPIAYTGIMSSGIAYTLQIASQKRLPPTAAALIMSLESVFAALSGWVILKQKMIPVEIFGCALIFAAIIMAQLPESKRKKQSRAQAGTG